MPPCATVTSALSVKTVALAFGNVNVLNDVVGPVTAKNPLFVPPFAPGRIPVTPVVSGSPVTFVIVPEVGVPSMGVTSEGDVAKTTAPVPVSPVTAAAKFAVDGVARKVATPVPNPLTPVAIGRPVALVSVAADGVPRFGVTSVGDVAKTKEPVPVSSVTAVIKFALDGVASQAAIPVPNPLTPVEIGRPVAFVSVPLAGVPRTGAISVGPLFKTTVEPVPVVVAALMAVPLPARTGLLMLVVRVIAGVDVAVATVPAKPFAVTTDTLDTVPAPALKYVAKSSISICQTFVVLDTPILSVPLNDGCAIAPNAANMAAIISIFFIVVFVFCLFYRSVKNHLPVPLLNLQTQVAAVYW